MYIIIVDIHFAFISVDREQAHRCRFSGAGSGGLRLGGEGAWDLGMVVQESEENSAETAGLRVSAGPAPG